MEMINTFPVSDVDRYINMLLILFVHINTSMQFIKFYLTIWFRRINFRSEIMLIDENQP